MKKLILPGWRGSGREHWQTRWELLDSDFTRVEQLDWETPTLPVWRAQLDLNLHEPAVLVAHSLGCLLAVHARQNVKAALLVAPPWLENLGEFASFWPAPATRLPFPSVVVASSNDPYCSMEKARQLATQWGSHLVDVGPHGHLNSESNLGDWHDGLQLLTELTASSA